MSYRFWADETKPAPRPVWAGLTCDGDHGLLPVPVLLLSLEPGGLDAWTQAVRQGWLVLPERQLCPECRGRAPKAVH